MRETKEKAWGWSAADASDCAGVNTDIKLSHSPPGQDSIRFLPSSAPTPQVRARDIRDLRFHLVADFFPDMEEGDILSFSINKDVEEGFLEVVYKIPLEKKDE